MGNQDFFMKVVAFEMGLKELPVSNMRNGNEVILNEYTSKWENEETRKYISWSMLA